MTEKEGGLTPSVAVLDYPEAVFSRLRPHPGSHWSFGGPKLLHSLSRNRGPSLAAK